MASHAKHLMESLPRLSWLYPLPSGKRLHNYGKIHHFVAGKIHYFDWAIFNSKLLVITRGYISHQQTHVVYCSLGYHMAKPLTHQPMAICLG